MIKVDQLKYLGFVISEDASNVPNISEKKKKSIGIIIIKNRMIYLNSPLRGSILYAAETYYSLSERNIRMLESTEEDSIRKTLETGVHSPISLLYLETGHIPAQFQIQIMMLNFFKSISSVKRRNHNFFVFFPSSIYKSYKG